MKSVWLEVVIGNFNFTLTIEPTGKLIKLPLHLNFNEKYFFQSYTKDGILYLKPTLTSESFGEEFLKSQELDIWGGQPGDRF